MNSRCHQRRQRLPSSSNSIRLFNRTPPRWQLKLPHHSNNVSSSLSLKRQVFKQSSAPNASIRQLYTVKIVQYWLSFLGRQRLEKYFFSLKMKLLRTKIVRNCYTSKAFRFSLFSVSHLSNWSKFEITLMLWCNKCAKKVVQLII